MLPLTGLTEGIAEVLVRLAENKVGDEVETTDVGNGTTEDMPAVGKLVIMEPLVEGWTDEGIRDTDIVDDATAIEEVVKMTTDEGGALDPEVVTLLSAVGLVPALNKSPVGASSADIV